MVMVTGDDLVSDIINFMIDSILPSPLPGIELSRVWISILCCGIVVSDEVAVPA